MYLYFIICSVVSLFCAFSDKFGGSMKRFFLTLVMAVNVTIGTFGYDKGLFDLDYFGNLRANFQVVELQSDGNPGLNSAKDEDIVKTSSGVKSYFKMTLPQKGINAAFKVIQDEGYSTAAYKTYCIIFSSYKFSKNSVVVIMKFTKDGSAWFDCYEVYFN